MKDYLSQYMQKNIMTSLSSRIELYICTDVAPWAMLKIEGAAASLLVRIFRNLNNASKNNLTNEADQSL